MFFFFLGIKSEVKVRKEQFFNMRIKYVLQGVIFHSHFFNQQMVMSLRVSELQVLLGYAGRNKHGRKHELLTKALHLLKAGCSPAVQMKIKELYRRRFPIKWFHRWTWPCLVFILPPVCPPALPSWDLTATDPRRLCCLFLYLALSMSWVCLTCPPPCTLYTLMSSSRDCHSMTCWMSSLSQPAWVSLLLPAQACVSDNTSLRCSHWWGIVWPQISEPWLVKTMLC